MSSARMIAPASMGNQKVPMSAKLRAATDRTANVVIQGMGFIRLVGIGYCRSAEESSQDDDDSRPHDGEADHC